MLHRDHTILRAATPGDLPVLDALRNDVQLQWRLLARPRPNPPAAVQAWVDRVSGDPHGVFFVVAEGDESGLTGVPVGFVQVVGMDLVSGHGRFGIAIAPAHQRQGHAGHAVALVSGYLHETFGLRKLVLEVRADNEPAVALYQRLGFRTVGVFEEHHRIGDRYYDVVIMERRLAT
jgi:RimJ/RimL family protein N-acetyltransferase